MNPEIVPILIDNTLNFDKDVLYEEVDKIKLLSSVKYDSYRNYRPGMRFVESLVNWLQQFSEPKEREIAYNFILEKLVYISERQMQHLVHLAYAQRILPILINQVAPKINANKYHIKKIVNSAEFKILLRKTIFLGMSDGARTDVLRRKHSLNNEQVYTSYEVSEEKWGRMQKKLSDWLEEKNYGKDAVFNNIFLLDDFSGSGNSIIREKNGFYTGKLIRFYRESLGYIDNPRRLGLVCSKGLNIYILTYVGTTKTLLDTNSKIEDFRNKQNDQRFNEFKFVDPVLIINDEVILSKDRDYEPGFCGLLEKYYDSRIEDSGTKTGQTDLKYGYAGCGLPLVLNHNCPNNSVFLLWAMSKATQSNSGLNALFPRIYRHWAER